MISLLLQPHSNVPPSYIEKGAEGIILLRLKLVTFIDLPFPPFSEGLKGIIWLNHLDELPSF